MKKIAVYITALILTVSFANITLAATSQSINVSATVPTTTNAMAVNISKITGSTWITDTAINFGSLVFDAENNIYMPSDGRYYAVDVYVQDNTGQTWTLTHTRQSLKSGTNTLDNNVNVTFAKQGSESGVDLSKVSFANSNNKAYTKTDLGTGNHLRIYYGLATGSKDAPGASPIGINQPAGTYTGSVTITLTP